MWVPRAFRALRFDPSRVDLRRVLAADGEDARHARALLPQDEAGDGRDGAWHRVIGRVHDLLRAGVLRKDQEPAVTFVRRRGEADGEEAVFLLCALDVAPPPTSGVPTAAPLPQEDERAERAADALACMQVVVAPVVGRFADPGGRLLRTLTSSADREADASWRDGPHSYEAFILDDESTTARVTTLLSTGGISVADAALSPHRALARRVRGGDEEGATPATHALAWLAPEGAPLPDVDKGELPVGVAILPLFGAVFTGDEGAT